MPWFIADDNFKEHWNRFVIEHDGSFLQSREWGEFQKKTGRKIWPLWYKDGDEIQAVALIIRHGLPFGFSYLYCPRGPLFNFQFSPPAGGFNFQKKSKIFEGLLEKIKEINAKEKAIFFKIEPGADFPFNLSDFGFMKSKKEIQPSQTVILDLTKTEEELLAEMKSKTRYNINLAERKDIKITQQTTHNSQLTTFLELLKETAEREGFRLHPKEYYEKLFAAHSPNFSVELFLAEYNGKTIAAHLLVFFGNPARTTDVIQSGGQAVYLHGASSREHKDAMAPYLLHWEAIKEAKRRGYLTYDFWGISEKKWPGLTRFKKGFGGAEKEYPGAFDLVFAQFWYWVYNIVRKII